MEIVIGVDASRCRSGGAYSHLFGILNNINLKRFKQIHIWTHKDMIKELPRGENIFYHTNNFINGNLLLQLFWQFLYLSKDLVKHKCDVLVSLDASTLAFYKKHIVLSRDMLSYEPGIIQLYPWYSKERIRLEAILFVQNRAFRRANGVIFLTQYASSIIQKSCGRLKDFTIIPHGISEYFRNTHQISINSDERRMFRCLYISPFDLYKNQWHVVESISILRQWGFDVQLDLIGGGEGLGKKRLKDAIIRFDPNGHFVNLFGKLSHVELIDFYKKCDLFIFASSCENMPNTLLEAMSAGIPIICSDKGPMPEVLGSCGVYFDPISPISISKAVLKIIKSPELSMALSNEAKKVASRYSWDRCSLETLNYVLETLNK
jgi:glycosyltransferase involved in cell wall biosynthesis